MDPPRALRNPRTLSGAPVNAMATSEADVRREAIMGLPGPVQYAGALPAILANAMLVQPYQAYSEYMDRGGHQPGGQDPEGLDLGIRAAGAVASGVVPGMAGGPRLGTLGGRPPIARANMDAEAVTGFYPRGQHHDPSRVGYHFEETAPPHPDYPNDPRRFEIVFRDPDGLVRGGIKFSTDADKKIINRN